MENSSSISGGSRAIASSHSTPPRRQFGTTLSANTPPRPSICVDPGTHKQVQNAQADSDFHARTLPSSESTSIDRAQEHDAADRAAANRFIEALLPSSLHMSPSLCDGVKSSTSPYPLSSRKPFATATTPVHDQNKSALCDQDSTDNNPSFRPERILSPSSIRSLSKSEAALSPAKPRYTVLLQVVKSLSAGQNLVPDVIGTSLTEKLSTILGSRTRPKELSETLANKTQLLLEFQSAAASQNNHDLGPPRTWTAPKPQARHSMTLQEQREGPKTAPRMWRRDECLGDCRSEFSAETLVGPQTQASPVKATPTCRNLSEGMIEQIPQVDAPSVSTNTDRLLESSDKQLRESLQELASVKIEMNRRLELKEAELTRKEKINAKELEESKDIIKSQQSKIEALEEKVQNMNEHEDSISEQRHLLLTDSVTYEALLLEAKNEISRLQNQLRSFESSHRNHWRETDSLRRDNKELTSQVSRLTAALEDKEDQLSAKSTEYMVCKCSFEDTKAELFQKKEELHFALRSNDKLQSKISHLNKKLAVNTKLFRDEKEQLSKEALELKKNLSEMQNSHAELDRIARSLRRNMTDSEARNTELMNQLAMEREATKRARQAARETQASVEEQVAGARAQLNKETLRRTELECECQGLQSRAASLEKEIKEREGKLSDLRSHLSKVQARAESEKQDLAGAIAREQQKSFELTSQLKVTHETVARLQHEMETMERSSEEALKLLRLEMESRTLALNNTIALKEQEIEKLKQTCQSTQESQSSLNFLNDALVEAQAEARRHEITVKETRAAYSMQLESIKLTNTKQLQRLEDENQELKSAQKKAARCKGIVEQQLSSTQENLKTVRCERDIVLMELEKVRSELHRTKDLVEELKRELASVGHDDSISDDYSDSGLCGLSRKELISRCNTLQKNLEKLETEQSKSELHIEFLEKRFEASQKSLKLLSEELKRVVDINGQLESTLAKCHSSLAVADKQICSLETETSRLVEAIGKAELEKEQHLERIRSLEESLAKTRKESAEQERADEELLRNLESQVRELTNEKLATSDKLCEMANDLERHKLLADETSCENKQLRSEVADLNSRITLTLAQLEDTMKINQQLQDTFQSNEALVTNQRIEVAEQECSSLQVRIDSLTKDLDLARQKINSDAAYHDELEQKLATQTQALTNSIRERESVETKLSHKLQLLHDRDESIKALESRVFDAENVSASLSVQCNSLRTALQKADDDLSSTAELHAAQMRNLEDEISNLEEERAKARKESSDLRDNLRDLRRKASDLEIQNKQLQSRLKSARQALTQSKADLAECRTNLDESLAAASVLKTESENDKSMIQQLTSHVELLDASLARLKAENLLLADAHRDAADEQNKKLQKIIAETDAKTRKLASLTELFHAQKDALARLLGSNQSPSEWMTNQGMRNAHLRTCTWAKHGMNRGIEALDLASVWKDSRSLDELCRGFATSDIQRTDDATEDMSRITNGTPKSKNKGNHHIMSTPDIKAALDSVRRLFQEEGPRKMELDTQDESQRHSQNVIQDLEIRIDALLFDLRVANEALRAKAQCLDDLMELVKHHEQEREKLGLQLEQRKATIRELEERLEHESARPVAHSPLHDDGTAIGDASTPPEGQTSPLSRVDGKIAAARMIAQFLESRSRLTTSTCFNKWARHAAVMKASQEQNRLAEDLAQELRTTQEKVCRLKQYMRKKGQLRDTNLDVIKESTDESESVWST